MDTSRSDGVEPLNVDTAGAARALGVSVSTLNRWRANGRGPAYVRLGGRVLYPVEGLERFNRERTALTATDETNDRPNE